MYLGLSLSLSAAALRQPAAVNLLTNSRLLGATSGAPGTAPTGWTASTAGGTITVEPAGTGANQIRVETTAARHLLAQASPSMAAASSYTWSGIMDVAVSLPLQDLFSYAALPTGTTVKRFVDGIERAGSYLVPVGLGICIEIVFTTADTAGTVSLRWGCGVTTAQTGSATFRDLQLNPGVSRGAYLAT